ADAMKLVGEIDAGNIQLGVMQGHEFAWAKSKCPTLVPIAVAIPMQPVQAFCLVKWDCSAKDIGDLKAEKISLPPIHREYCDLYLKKLQSQYLKDGFAGRITAALATDAIQDVIDGKAGCTIVDAATLRFF